MKKWFTVSMGEPLLPRFKLTTENKNYLLSWAMVTHIETSKDFLSLQFICEIGMVQRTLHPRRIARVQDYAGGMI